MPHPFKLTEKKAILAWGKEQKAGYCRNFEYSHDGNHAIVLLVDFGSGVYLDTIYVFGKSKEMEEWRFILYRPTNAQVEIHKEKDKLVFKTVNGDVILEQSFYALKRHWRKGLEKDDSDAKTGSPKDDAKEQSGKK